MNIGQAAELSGLPAKTLRYYEEIGLVSPKRKAGSDYRDYSLDDVESLRFLQRSRAVGFSLEVCKQLLELYRDQNRRCSQVKALVVEKLTQIDKQLVELQALRAELQVLADSCEGGASSDCAIIETLSSTKVQPMPFFLIES